MKFSLKAFSSKPDQIRRKLWIWSHLLKKYLMKNFIYCECFTRLTLSGVSPNSDSFIFQIYTKGLIDTIFFRASPFVPTCKHFILKCINLELFLYVRSALFLFFCCSMRLYIFNEMVCP